MPIPTITEAAAQIAARTLSPVELTQNCLERIARLEPMLRTGLDVQPERAVANARAAETRMMAGALRGPLDGIPIAHRDFLAPSAEAAVADATVASILAAAGTVLLGAFGTHLSAPGGTPAVNPWNPAHGTGGSGAGAGAAVATGFILGGTGADTCGAVRRPAALCGIAGLKPTQALVPRAGMSALSHSLDHVGLMAWTVADCALLLQAMAARDPGDASGARRSIPDYRTALSGAITGVRVGLARNFHETDAVVSPATRTGIDTAAGVFAALGAELVEVTLPSLKNYQACGMVLLLAEAAGVPGTVLEARLGDDGALLRHRLALGKTIGAGDYARAQRFRQDLAAQTLTAMAGVDLLLTATQADEAARVVQPPAAGLDEPANFLFPGSVTGFPSLSVCCGFGAGGLPVAIQLLGKPFAESLLLRAGHAYETATPWRRRRPGPTAVLMGG